MKKLPLPRVVLRPARTVLIYGAAVVLTLIMLLWHLGSSPAQASLTEVAAKTSSRLSAIADNVLFAPWKVLEDGLVHITHQGMWLPRLTSVIFGLICLAAFYYCMKVWLGNAVALLTSTFLLTTPIFLLSSRYATPWIMYFWPIVMVAAYLYFRRSSESLKGLLLLAVAVGIGLYVPGFMWLVLIAVIFKWSAIREGLAETERRDRLLAGLLLLILVVPRVAGLIVHPNLILGYFLLPDHFTSVASEAKNWLWAGSSLVFRARQHEDLILGRSGLLDITLMGLILFGGFVLFDKLRSAFFMIVAILLLVTLLVGLSGNYPALGLLITPLLIVVGFGLRFLYIEWKHTFPNNPLPRYFAYGLMAAVVLIHVIYGVRYGLIAWPIA